jgi:hypothetical protein
MICSVIKPFDNFAVKQGLTEKNTVMRKRIYLIGMIISALMLVAGCDKTENTDQNAVLEVRLTDAPGEYDEVLIDVQDVQIHVSDNEEDGEWQSLSVNTGVYNLLDFRNGMDTLLAFLELPAGTISQMRLVLGSNNRVKVDGDYHDLDTPSAQQSGLKFNIHATLTAGIVYRLWIDFDAARSIVVKGNGGYSLKPVIRTYTDAIGGAISGNVSPMEALPYVKAIANGDTIGTFAGENGQFLISAVPEGLYSVVFEPVMPYLPDTVPNVTVINGEVTVMDTVYFDQE